MKMFLKIGEQIKEFAPKKIYPSWPRPARVIHYHERYGLSYIAYKEKYEGWPVARFSGDPAVVHLIQTPGEKSPKLTPEIEWWWFNLMKESCNNLLPDATIKNCYKNTLRGDKAYTDFRGYTNGRQSVVLNVNIGCELQQLGGVIANGATIKVLGNKQRVAGKDVYPVEVINSIELRNKLKNNLPVPTYRNDIFTTFAATNSTRAPFPKGVVDPFPVLGDAGYSVPIPLMCEGRNYGYIECAWIEFLPYEILDTKERQYPYYLTNYKMNSW